MGQKVGAVIVADEASLARVGVWTGFEWALSQLRRSDALSEILVVSESEAVRRLARAWEVRCVGFSEVQAPAWVQVAGEQAAAHHGAQWPNPSGATSPRQAAVPTAEPPAERAHDAQLARLDLNLHTVDPRADGLLRALGLDVVLFVDASCPLWELDDIALCLQACERANRAVLASRASRIWTAQHNAVPSELVGPAFVELEVLRAMRVSPDADLAALEFVLTHSWKGWSLREPTERLAVASVWLERRKHYRQEQLPAVVGALVMDFDGVLTDNRVLVQQDGTESVWCHRGDGLGLELLRKSGLPMLVISKEKNPVVQARCAKLKLECLSGVDEKLSALQVWCERQQVSRHQVVFVGNDINDLECLTWSGCGVAVQDSHPEVLRVAALTLEQHGGHGAIRELAEMILLRNGVRLPVRSEH